MSNFDTVAARKIVNDALHNNLLADAVAMAAMALDEVERLQARIDKALGASELDARSSVRVVAMREALTSGSDE